MIINKSWKIVLAKDQTKKKEQYVYSVVSIFPRYKGGGRGGLVLCFAAGEVTFNFHGAASSMTLMVVTLRCRSRWLLIAGGWRAAAIFDRYLTQNLNQLRGLP